MQKEKWDFELDKAISDAETLATQLYKAEFVEAQHIVYCILQENPFGSFYKDVFEQMGITTNFLCKKLEQDFPRGESEKAKHSADLKKLLNRVYKNRSVDVATVSDFFNTLMKSKEPCAGVLKSFGFDIDSFNEVVDDILDEMTSPVELELTLDNGKVAKKFTQTVNALNKYAINLSELAKKGELSECIGREPEIQQIREVLNKTMKRNVMLIGAAGSGKTAIVEGLAQVLSDKTIYSIDVNKLVSGTKYRGELEQNMGELLEELKNPNVIGFIDEAHMLRDGVGSDGGISLINVLKPYMARDGVQMILATTTEEHQKHLSYDTALMRRCTVINVEPPSRDVTLNIMNAFQNKVNAKFSDGLLELIYDNASEHIVHKNMPDVALEIMDVCIASEKTSGDFGGNELLNAKKTLHRKKTSIAKKGDYDKINEVKALEDNVALMERASKKRNLSRVYVNEDVVKNVFKRNFSIEVNKVYDWKTYEADVQAFEKLIYGQSKHINTLLERHFVNCNYKNEKPSSYFLAGPTGVGKTMFASLFAKHYCNNNMLIIDCADYQQSFAIDQLIGVPKGYVGSEDGGILTNFISRYPNGTILLDEIEKAHPNLFNLLLPLLDKGIITDKQGATFNAKNNKIFFTSNVGFSDTAPSIGFNNSSENHINLEKRFSKEFLNRLSEVVVFNSLSKSDYQSFLDNEIENIKNLYPQMNIVFSKKTKDSIVSKAMSKNYGIRYLKNILERDIVKNIVIAKMKNQTSVMI